MSTSSLGSEPIILWVERSSGGMPSMIDVTCRCWILPFSAGFTSARWEILSALAILMSPAHYELACTRNVNFGEACVFCGLARCSVCSAHMQPDFISLASVSS